ncbi:MAG: endonuclease III [Candidatus Kapaibacterium sp.]|nr:MAG: endonuclease III [Candidatus Kapabacteria bacterium]
MPKPPSLTQATKRLGEILTRLQKDYPNPRIALDYSSPFELLIATMLSAQCTDERVNKVTAKLFVKYRSAQDYIKVPQEELEQDIFSTGFYKAKAKNIQACCAKLLADFQGEVPRTLDELTSLAGVGRKTANVVLSHCFDTPGVVVDTHVTRLVNRLGLCDGTDAVQLEFELMKLMPSTEWRDFTHLMISHGRAICTARTRPFCDRCSLEDLCVKNFSSAKK